MIACTEHWLDGVDIKIDPRFSVTVVAAAGGIRDHIRGDIITLDTVQDETRVPCGYVKCEWSTKDI
jgi:phosphoribosylamine--glycine ligase/phosphoribosylformylglycinamidine cyclo-ligase